MVVVVIVEHGLILLALDWWPAELARLLKLVEALSSRCSRLAIYFGIPDASGDRREFDGGDRHIRRPRRRFMWSVGVSNISIGHDATKIATTSGAGDCSHLAGYSGHGCTLAAVCSVFPGLHREFDGKKAWSTRKQELEPEIALIRCRRYPLGSGASLLAGDSRDDSGIGGGPVKVPIMYLFMGVPLRVATATSNFMIGVTAATSAFIYYGRGDVHLHIAAPIVIGVFAGSMLGARFAPKVKATYVLSLLVFVTAYLAVTMLWRVCDGEILMATAEERREEGEVLG